MHWGRHPPVQCMLGYTPPGQTPPWADNPQADTPWVDTHPWADTPHIADGYCSGWYPSYWNAFLFGIIFTENRMKMRKKMD